MKQAGIIFLRGIKVALVVGFILNVINQGTIVADGDWSNFSFMKLILNFLTPLIVSVYTGIVFNKGKQHL